jgi:hypothetical protein
MITKLLLTIILAPFRAALALLPAIDPPDVAGLVSAMAPVFQLGGWANNFVPLSEAVTLLGVMMTAFAAITVVRATLWVLTKAHILGGSS